MEEMAEYKAESSTATNPRHYRNGSIECWDYIISQKMDFLEGNIIKYVTRYKEKNGIEDLEKAKVYLDKLMDKVRKDECKWSH